MHTGLPVTTAGVRERVDYTAGLKHQLYAHTHTLASKQALMSKCSHLYTTYTQAHTHNALRAAILVRKVLYK